MTFQSWIGQNPVTLKELRGRMRGGRAFWVLSLNLLILSGALSLVFFSFFASESSSFSASVRQTLGKTLFGVVIGMQLLTVCFISPALTAGAISSERERQTFDLIRTTLLTARTLVLGKLAAAISFLILLLFTAFPLQSLAFLFGGIAWEEVLIGSLLLVVTAIAFSTIGLFFSSFARRTLVSTISAYGTTILLVFGIPIFLLITTMLTTSILASPAGRLSDNAEIILIAIAWFLVSLNPIATAIVTETVLIEEQSAFLFDFPLGGGNTITLLSPWISYVFIYVIGSMFLIWVSILLVRRIEE